MSEEYVPVMPSRRVSSVLRGIVPGDGDPVERAKLDAVDEMREAQGSGRETGVSWQRRTEQHA